MKGTRSSVLAFLAVLSLFAASCSNEKGMEVQDKITTISSLQQGAEELSMLQAQSELLAGGATFSFGMVSNQGDLLTGGSPEVWVATNPSTAALGPFAATFHRFEAYEQFDDHSPRSPLTGFYSVDVAIPRPGTWTIAAVAEQGSSLFVATGTMTVVEQTQAAQIGTEAISAKTPVAAEAADLKKICTRAPPDPMHYISLDKALSNGKPTVVSFSTPALCESRLCGPVVDEMFAVFDSVGKERANFVHVEEFPERIQNKPAPAFVAWGFQTEPWTVVIDREGIIRAAFEGPVVASQIQEALAPLL